MKLCSTIAVVKMGTSLPPKLGIQAVTMDMDVRRFEKEESQRRFRFRTSLRTACYDMMLLQIIWIWAHGYGVPIDFL
jgi:hypothetical protein